MAMVTLNLSEGRTRLPASTFPKPADVYLCDSCGRDVTRHFNPRQSHTWYPPIGRERFSCACGHPYLTGAVEWDHLDDRERQRRRQQVYGMGLFFSAGFLIPGLLAYWGLRFAHHPTPAVITAWIITTFPAVLLVVPFWFEIAVSMWRTRSHD